MAAPHSHTGSLRKTGGVWFLTVFLGFSLSWAFINAWPPLSWDDEEMLAPVLIALVVSAESLVVIRLSRPLIKRALAIPGQRPRRLAMTVLSTGTWLASCAGTLLFANTFHWKALVLSALAYLASLLLATGLAYRRRLFRADAAFNAPGSDD